MVIFLLVTLADAKPAAVQSTCKAEKLTSTGTKHRAIDDATASAIAAAKAEMTRRYGPGWTTGSRRGARFTCAKPMGGPAGRLGWTCSLVTDVCRDFSR